jgi:hypothetical protein
MPRQRTKIANVCTNLNPCCEDALPQQSGATVFDLQGRSRRSRKAWVGRLKFRQCNRRTQGVGIACKAITLAIRRRYHNGRVADARQTIFDSHRAGVRFLLTDLDLALTLLDIANTVCMGLFRLSGVAINIQPQGLAA